MGSDFDHYVMHKFPFQKGLFAEIVNDLLLLSVFAKHLILSIDVWMGSKYASMQMIFSKYKVFITILTFFLFLFLIVVILNYY